jgi:predicted transposase YdaD
MVGSPRFVPTPHDKLVRRTFGDLQHARGLLRSLVPNALATRVDWSTLALVDGSFIDPQLAERQTDLLYTVELEQRPVLLYLLLEHQSSSDRWMPLRMLVYVTRIWERHREQHPNADKLPAIVPMVLHHSEKGWSAPTSLVELLDADSALRGCLEPYVADFQFRLIDLTHQDDRELHGWLTTDLGKLVALCLKHAPYDSALESRLRNWLELLGRVVRAPGGVAGLNVVSRYLLEVNDITADRLRHVLESALDPEALEAVMTGAERLREEGRAEGRAKALLQLLDQRFGPLPGDVTERVLRASVQELEVWTGRVLSAASLEMLLN